MPRTAPCSSMDTVAGRDRVRHLLRIYAKHDPEVGYVQGMSFVAARCLQAFGGDKADGSQQMMAFALFCRIMHGPVLNLRSVVGANLCGVERLYREHAAVLRTVAPRIAAHFDRLEIRPALYVEWFLSLFGLPLRGEELDDAWTYMLEGGWPAAYAIATQMMIELWPYMEGADFSETMMVMKSYMQHWSVVDRVDARRAESAADQEGGRGAGGAARGRE